MPPVAEQRSIAEHLDAKIEQKFRLVEHLGRQIDLLREHRQALIASAVTGELGIPGVAA
jgi:type I restriction enzyme S subunit